MITKQEATFLDEMERWLRRTSIGFCAAFQWSHEGSVPLDRSRSRIALAIKRHKPKKRRRKPASLDEQVFAGYWWPLNAAGLQKRLRILRAVRRELTNMPPRRVHKRKGRG